jgi:hypothetical protein
VDSGDANYERIDITDYKYNKSINDANIILISDYNKGYLTEDDIVDISRYASDHAHIFLDTKKPLTERILNVVDYVKITKNRKAGLNTYTAYNDFCTWTQPDGFCLKESCIRRWNGADAENPTSYSWENWGLEMNKSTWYNSHNIDVLCQAFDNRTTETFEPLNWTIVQDTYFASLVLGYDDFYISQPDFQYAHTIYLYDIGEDMAQGY